MDPTRVKVSLFLGRHRGPESGLWVYGRGLVGALAATKERSNYAQLKLVYAGPETLRTDLNSVLHSDHSVIFKELPSTAAGRRFGFITDLLAWVFNGADLVHGTANTLPLRGGRRRVLTLHDLIQAYPPLGCRGFYQNVRALWYRLQLFLLVRSVDLILVDHEMVQDEIVRHFGSHTRIEVVYPGLDRAYTEAPLPTQVNESNELIAFATLDPRKNIDGALYAFQRLAQNADFKLNVIVNDARIVPVIEEKISRLGLSSRCKIHLKISTAELLDLYRRARALIFPSFAEGFGYPVYEALSQGVPVVCAEQILIKRIQAKVAPAVFNCDPTDKDSIYLALSQVVRISQEARWREEIARSVRALLNVERCAEEVLRLYRDVTSTLS